MAGKRKLRALAFWGWFVIMMILTSFPKHHNPPDQIMGLDKIAHFTMFAVFSVLYVRYRATGTSDIKKILRGLLWISAFLPLLDELHQIPIPGRFCSVWDILADLLGMWGVALVIYLREEKYGYQKSHHS